jgi:CPA1 family monovalent cation:H+ antiporter
MTGSLPVGALGLMLLVACLVAIVCRRLHLPYAAGLVAAGMALPLAGPAWHVRMAPDVIYNVLLPPLIFEAALQLDLRRFARDLGLTLTLALPGMALTAAIVAAGMMSLLGWTLAAASLFGTLIAATDPVSVIALFREMRVSRRLTLLVESESLLNDGTAAVGFAVVLGIVQGSAPHALGIAAQLAWMMLGGVAIGALVAGGSMLLIGRTDDHLVEITLTTIAAYASFLLAQYFGASGVLAAMTAGLVLGEWGLQRAISEASRPHVVAFWDYAAFLANSIVFLLIGGYEAHEGRRIITVAALAAIGLVLLARAATVYPICLLFSRGRGRVALRAQHVLAWGGLRGALALALSLSIPDGLPNKIGIVSATFAVVAFSIFVQGLTMKPLARALRLGGA